MATGNINRRLIIGVDADLAGFNRDFARISQAIAGLGSVPHSIRVNLDTAGLSAEIARIQAELNGLNGNIGNLGNLGGGGGGLFRGVNAGGLLAGLGITAAAKELVDTTREVERLQSRLSFFTADARELADANAFISQTAKDLNKDLLGLGDGYAKLIPLQKSGVLSGGEQKDLFIGLANAQSALGASNEQLKQSLFGLAQALSSPVVRAEELNQVVEPLPGLLQAMDRAANLPAGGFRKLINDGNATSAVFKTVLIGALREFDGAAARTGQNIDSVATRIGNSWTELARAAQTPINFVANVTGNAVTGALNSIAENFRQAEPGFKSFRDSFKGSIDEALADLAKFDQFVANRQAVGILPQGEIEKLERDRSRLIDNLKKLTEEQKAITDGVKQKSTPDPVIDLSGLEAEKKRADSAKKANDILAQSQIRVLELQGKIAEAARLEGQQRGLTGDDLDKYIKQQQQIAQLEESNRAAKKSNSGAANDRTEQIRAAAAQTIAQLKQAQETARAEQQVEIARAGSDSSKRLEIEQRYIDNFRVLKEEELKVTKDAKQKELALTDDAGQQAKLRSEIVNVENEIIAVRKRAGLEVDALAARETVAARQRIADLKDVFEAANDKRFDDIINPQQRADRRSRVLQGTAAGLEDERRRLQQEARDALNAGDIGEDEFAQKLKQIQKDTAQTSDVAQQLGLTFNSAFENAVVNGAKFSDVLKGIGADLLRLGIRKSLTEPFLEFLNTAVTTANQSSSSGGSFWGSLLSSVVGGLFGGGKASGGPISANKFYLVGENGPEILGPGVAGHITPMRGSVGAGASAVNVNIHNYGANVQAEAKPRADGGFDLDLLVEQKVKKVMGSGRLDSTFRTNGVAQSRGIRR